MCGSVLKDKTSINDRVASLRTLVYQIIKSFSNSSNKLGRNICSYHFANKFIPRLVALGINWFDITDDSSVLTCTSCLLFMKKIEVLFLEYSLTIIYARLSCFTVYSKLSFYPLNVDLKMKLTHATDNHFLGLFVNGNLEGRIFPLKFRKSFL